jgi:peptide-methionine (R)-S-oxide reductase
MNRKIYFGMKLLANRKMKNQASNYSIGFITCLALLSFRCGTPKMAIKEDIKTTKNMSDTFEIQKSEEEWKKTLSAEEYRVLREKGTERAFTSEYETLWDTGTYVCKACGNELFHSSTKFDAQCGWPSFYKTIDKSHVREVRDVSHGMERIEVVCGKCGGHLGHVFDDAKYFGQPENSRYCINGVSIGFKKK